MSALLRGALDKIEEEEKGERGAKCHCGTKNIRLIVNAFRESVVRKYNSPKLEAT